MFQPLEDMGSHQAWKDDPLVCLGCGSPYVHVQMWVEVATGRVDWKESPWELYTDPKDSGICATYCHRCEADHGTACLSDVLGLFNVLAVLTTGEALWVGSRCPSCYWEYRWPDGRDPNPDCGDDTSHFGCKATRDRRAARAAREAA